MLINQHGQKQSVPATLGSTCRTHRIVLHLICHALGMWHEHSRPDRDLYVEILKENVDPDNVLRNFNRHKEFEVKNYGQTEYMIMAPSCTLGRTTFQKIVKIR